MGENTLGSATRLDLHRRANHPVHGQPRRDAALRHARDTVAATPALSILRGTDDAEVRRRRDAIPAADRVNCYPAGDGGGRR